MVLDQFQYYIIAISACVCFLVFICAGRTILEEGISKYFVAGTIAILIVVIAEIAEKAFAPPVCAHVSWQRWMFSIIGYMLRPGIAYIMVMIPLRRKKKKYARIMALPLAVNAIFLLMSPINGIVFTYGATNDYTSGPLRYLPFAIGAAYLVAFLVVSSVELRNTGDSELLVSIPVVIMCALAVYLESWFDLLGSLPTAYIIGMIFYYVYFYMECYSKDALTGAYRRNRFYQDIKSDGFRYFVLFDVNGLKRINDNIGHMAGDNAIRSFGQTVFAVLPKRALFYRIGGDEFAVVYHRAGINDINHFLDKIKENLDYGALPYGMSFGFSSFDKAEDFNDAYREADKMLYECKNRFWRKYRRTDGGA